MARHKAAESLGASIRMVPDHAPPEAMFALDPYFMHIPGEYKAGFRAIAHRSTLADGITDSGAVSTVKVCMVD